eukprot:8899463-Lingulodinium_polyedra.AAC.1
MFGANSSRKIRPAFMRAPSAVNVRVCCKIWCIKGLSSTPSSSSQNIWIAALRLVATRRP